MPIRKPLTQYPIPLASKKIAIVDLKGLASYAAETLRAADFGEKAIEAIIPLNVGVVAMPHSGGGTTSVPVALSFSGTYFVTARLDTTTVAGYGSQSVTIRWYVTATGAEAGAIDLSAESARVMIVFG